MRLRPTQNCADTSHKTPTMGVHMPHPALFSDPRGIALICVFASVAIDFLGMARPGRALDAERELYHLHKIEVGLRLVP